MSSVCQCKKKNHNNKGNNKITELRTILQKGKSKLISIYTDKISQQPEN